MPAPSRSPRPQSRPSGLTDQTSPDGNNRRGFFGQVKKDVGDFVRGTKDLLANPGQLIDGTYRGRNTHNASNFDADNFTSPDRKRDREQFKGEENEVKKAKTPRPSTKSDASVLAAAQRRRNSGRGRGLLASVYRLPADAGRAAQTLQNFNGPQGRNMKLGQ